jgi:hypothetical protein
MLEKDPLVDDTVIFMNRVRNSLIAAGRESKAANVTDPDTLKVKILPGNLCLTFRNVSWDF